MANTKITTPDLIDLPAVDNFAGVVLPKGPTNGLAVHYLVVAGGGAGAPAGAGGGGGGAGGLRTSFGSNSGGGSTAETNKNLATGTSYTITVGAGGAAITASSYNTTKNDGEDSVFDDITSTGGGGGSGGNTSGNTGGSGGGGNGGYGLSAPGGAGTTNQGYAGGTRAGSAGGSGGGGAAAVGVGGGTTGNDGGTGGAGLEVNIIGGTGNYYAGGGGGGVHVSGTPGTGGTGGGGSGGDPNGNNGTANTGGGGGGGSTLGSSTSGAGGSGVVVIRVPTGITASFSSGVTANGSTGGTIAPDTSTGDNIWIVTATTDASQTVTFSGTVTGGRPSSAVDGEFRYNTTDKRVEYYDGSNWHQLSSSTVVPQSGTTTSCNYPTTGAALYQLNNDGGSTNNVPDTCGSYNGTSTDITYAAGKYGNAAQFNGSTSLINLPDNSIFDLAASTSLSFWVYRTNSTSHIINKGNPESYAFWWGTNYYLTIYTSAGSTSLITSTANTTSTWYNFVITVDSAGTGYKLYMDANLEASVTSGTININTGDVRIGSYPNGSYDFGGALDQIRWFNTTLTATQVNALYTETAP